METINKKAVDPELPVKVAALKDKLANLCTEYNAANNYFLTLAQDPTIDKEDHRKLADIMQEMQETENEHKKTSYALFVAECRTAENPMKAFMLKLAYPTIKAASKKQDSDDPYPKMVVEDKSTYADIVKFGQALENDRKWLPRMMRLRSDLHDLKAGRMKAKVGELKLTQEAVDLKTDKNLVKMTSLSSIEEYVQMEMQRIADGMLGEKVVEVELRDAFRLVDVCTSVGKGRHATAFMQLHGSSRGDDFATTIAKAFNRALTNDGYTMECKDYKKS